MRAGWALNCEDEIVFADAALRAELKARHPAVAARIEARRNFVRDELGIAITDSIIYPFIDALVPSALLACGRTIAGAGMTVVDKKGARKAAALTRRLIRFREICVNSVD